MAEFVLQNNIRGLYMPWESLDYIGLGQNKIKIHEYFKVY